MTASVSAVPLQFVWTEEPGLSWFCEVGDYRVGHVFGAFICESWRAYALIDPVEDTRKLGDFPTLLKAQDAVERHTRKLLAEGNFVDLLEAALAEMDKLSTTCAQASVAWNELKKELR